MRKVLYIIIALVVFALSVNGQRRNTIALQVSINQIEINYQRNIFTPKIWGEVYVGLGNQDITNSFNDIITGIRTGANLISKGKNIIAVNTDFGIYIPNNSLYNATTPIVGAGIRYIRTIGKQNKHTLFVSTGYRYGQKDYKQRYNSDIVSVESIETFKISPVYISIGYGFSFN